MESFDVGATVENLHLPTPVKAVVKRVIPEHHIGTLLVRPKVIVQFEDMELEWLCANVRRVPATSEIAVAIQPKVVLIPTPQPIQVAQPTQSYATIA